MIRLVFGWFLVNGLLMFPLWLAALLGVGPGGAWVALEGALLVGILALLPRRRWSRWLATGAALVLVLVTVVAFADLVFQVALARSLNLFIDLYLLRAVYDLAVGNSGLALTLVYALGILLVLGAATYALGRLMTPPEGKGGPAGALGPKLAGVALVALFAVGWVLVDEVTSDEETPLQAREPFVFPVAQMVRTQTQHHRTARRERDDFASELAGARDSYADVPGLLSKLDGKDVLLTFIESYGMAVLTVPEIAAVMRPRLDTLAQRMSAAGIHLVSGSFTSPTQGGQSWYAHGTVLSGLWLDNQVRYDLLLASDRETLVDDFRRAGHHTAAVFPAITVSWPEGERLGFDDLFTTPNIPYAGPPMYWVTMPDQFTWSFLGNEVRAAAGGKPLFAAAGMVSSHAPWTPILPMLDWDSIGNGAVFERYRAEGHPPERLWVDIEQLRAGYARSIDYSVQAMTGFAERFLDERTLLIVIGDHQAAPWVTGARGNRVPVHVMSRDATLLEPFLEWGFVPGAFPDEGLRPPRMDELRDWLVHAYSEGAPHSLPPTAKGGL
jgi:hypothetical protein